MIESDLSRAGFDGCRVVYVGSAGVSDALERALELTGVSVDRQADVYRGLAHLAGVADGSSSSLAGVVVCVDGLGFAGYEFFGLARGLVGQVPVVAYSRSGSRRRLRDARLAGATGVVEATVDSLSGAFEVMSAQPDTECDEAPEFARAPVNDGGLSESASAKDAVKDEDRRGGSGSDVGGRANIGRLEMDERMSDDGTVVRDDVGKSGCSEAASGALRFRGIEPLLSDEEIELLLAGAGDEEAPGPDGFEAPIGDE